MPNARLLALFLAILWAAYVSAQAQPDRAEAEPRGSVDKILILYDQGKFGEIYDTTLDPAFKANFSREQFDSLSAAFSKRTGKCLNRLFVREATSMGIHRFIFDTNCEEGRIFEDIAVKKDHDRWLAVNIAMAPNYDAFVWQNPDSITGDTSARQSVDKTLALFDQGDYAAMYNTVFHSTYKAQGTEANWIQSGQTLAAGRGKVLERKLIKKSVGLGVRRFLFATNCTGGNVFEEVAVLEEEGNWKVVIFAIRPNFE